MTIDRARLVETIQHFRLIDDTYFNVFMEDNYDDMGLFLRIILSDPTIKLVSVPATMSRSDWRGPARHTS